LGDDAQRAAESWRRRTGHAWRGGKGLGLVSLGGRREPEREKRRRRPVAAMAAAGAGVVDRGLERSYQRMGIAHQVGRSKGPTEIMLFLVFLF
jgi:hypothetical protein